MPEQKGKMRTVEFGPERAESVRKVAVQATEMLFDIETGHVFFAGRGQFAIAETVMKLTLPDVANLAAQMLQISVATLMEAIQAAETVKNAIAVKGRS